MLEKVFLQHDLAKNKLNILTFFAMGLFFLTNLANFGRVSAPEIFLRETMVNKRIWIIKDNYHMEFIVLDWVMKVEKWTFMIFFRQCHAM